MRDVACSAVRYCACRHRHLPAGGFLGPSRHQDGCDAVRLSACAVGGKENEPRKLSTRAEVRCSLEGNRRGGTPSRGDQMWRGSAAGTIPTNRGKAVADQRPLPRRGLGTEASSPRGVLAASRADAQRGYVRQRAGQGADRRQTRRQDASPPSGLCQATGALLPALAQPHRHARSYLLLNSLVYPEHPAMHRLPVSLARTLLRLSVAPAARSANVFPPTIAERAIGVCISRMER